jgi:hypothetical protein
LGARRRGNIEDALGVLEDNPPRDRPYDKDAIYTVMARMALEELRTARDPNGLIKRFYANNKKVIEETIEQLNAGLPVELTRMFLKMATGKFNLGRLIGLLKSAAESEFTASGVTDVSTEEGYGTKETGAAGGPAMGKLRDSYMLHRILAAKEANYVLAGVGDAHRENLEKVLKKRDPNILVMPSSKFYAEQYQRYPDRD